MATLVIDTVEQVCRQAVANKTDISVPPHIQLFCVESLFRPHSRLPTRRVYKLLKRNCHCMPRKFDTVVCRRMGQYQYTTTRIPTRRFTWQPPLGDLSTLLSMPKTTCKSRLVVFIYQMLEYKNCTCATLDECCIRASLFPVEHWWNPIIAYKHFSQRQLAICNDKYPHYESFSKLELGSRVGTNGEL